MNAQALYYDPSRRIVLSINRSDNKVDFVQHLSGEVGLHSLDVEKFDKMHTKAENHKPLPEIAQALLDAGKHGIVITPAARFALTGIINPNSQEANMPIPTAVKKEKKVATKKVKDEDLPLASAKVVAGPTAPTPAGKALIESLKTPLPKKEESKPEVQKEESKPEVQTGPHHTMITVTAPLTDTQMKAKQIVDTARVEAQKLLDDLNAKLEEAKKLTEDQKMLDDAKAEAQKIIQAAKKEGARIQAAIKALGKNKRGTKRTPKGEAKPKAEKSERKPRVDVSGKKIKLINEPNVREGSERGARISAVVHCKTTDEALEYEGVNASLILKLVEAGYIELV